MSLMRRLVLGDLDLTDYPFSVEFDEDHGSPENVYDTLVSMLADGELMSSSRVGNREITLTVLVEGPTLADLALNEATLIAECEKQRSTLSIDPGDTYAVSSVFDIFRVQARLQYDADLEQGNFRRYELTIPASPYPRTEDLITTTAVSTPGVPAAETVLFDGTSATGWWTYPPAFAAATVSAGTLVSATSNPASIFRATGSELNLSTGGYLAVTWQASAPAYTGGSYPWPTIGISQSGVPGSSIRHPHVLTTTSGAWTTTFVAIPAGMTAASFQVSYNFNSGVTGTLTIDKVSQWNRLPDLGTGRQKSMSVIPGGSVRTQGSIVVEHPTTSLGKTIVYTHPSGTGYMPPLRTWRVSSEAVTADTSLFSGARNALGPTSTVYRIPASALPEGRAEVWAWVRTVSGTGAKSIDWAIASYIGGSSLSYTVTATTVTLPVLNTWYLVSLGAATMPPVKVGPGGSVEVHLHHGNSDVQVDEAYLFATDEGRLTIVDCGSTPTSRLLWIDAPSSDNNGAGGIYRGNVPDRSDAWHAGSTADVWQSHNFDPGGASVFVATQLDSEISLEHYRRYHTHVSDV